MALQLLKVPNHTIILPPFCKMGRSANAWNLCCCEVCKETLRWTYMARYTASQYHVIIFSARDTRWRCTMSWKVCVDGKVVNKAGTPVSDKALVQIIAEVPKYVCRAGHKLEAAIEQLGIDVSGKVALDSGLSTGGFTDCLLRSCYYGQCDEGRGDIGHPG